LNVQITFYSKVHYKLALYAPPGTNPAPSQLKSRPPSRLLKNTEIQVQKTLIKGAKMLSCPTNTKPQLLSNDRKGNPKCRQLSHFG
jgi:hypothetical protein